MHALKKAVTRDTIENESENHNHSRSGSSISSVFRNNFQPFSSRIRSTTNGSNSMSTKNRSPHKRRKSNSTASMFLNNSSPSDDAHAWDAIIGENRALKNEVELYKSHLEAITDEKDMLANDYSKLKTNVTNATTQLRIMTRRYNKLKEKNEEYKKHFQNTMKLRMNESQENIGQLNAQLNDLRSKYDTLYAEYANKRSIIDQHKKQNRKLKLKYKQLEKDFDDFMDGNMVHSKDSRYPKTSDLIQKCKHLSSELNKKENDLAYVSQLILVLYENAAPVIFRNHPGLAQIANTSVNMSLIPMETQTHDSSSTTTDDDDVSDDESVSNDESDDSQSSLSGEVMPVLSQSRRSVDNELNGLKSNDIIDELHSGHSNYSSDGGGSVSSDEELRMQLHSQQLREHRNSLGLSKIQTDSSDLRNCLDANGIDNTNDEELNRNHTPRFVNDMENTFDEELKMEASAVVVKKKRRRSFVMNGEAVSLHIPSVNSHHSPTSSASHASSMEVAPSPAPPPPLPNMIITGDGKSDQQSSSANDSSSTSNSSEMIEKRKVVGQQLSHREIPVNFDDEEIISGDDEEGSSYNST